MARRSKRGSVDTGGVVSKLAVGRDGAVDVRRQASIGGPAYEAAGEMMEAVDKLAETLTGDATCLHMKAHSVGSCTPDRD